MNDLQRALLRLAGDDRALRDDLDAEQNARLSRHELMTLTGLDFGSDLIDWFLHVTELEAYREGEDWQLYDVALLEAIRHRGQEELLVKKRAQLRQRR